MTFNIHVTRKGKEDIEEALDVEEFVIGRASNCDVTVRSSHVSSRHAKVMSGVVLVDLDSTNGTYIDGKRVKGAVLLKDREFILGVGKDQVHVNVVSVPDDLGNTVALLDGGQTLQIIGQNRNPADAPKAMSASSVGYSKTSSGESRMESSAGEESGEDNGADLSQVIRERDELARSHRKLLDHLKVLSKSFEELEQKVASREEEVERLRKKFDDAKVLGSIEALEPVMQRLREVIKTDLSTCRPEKEKDPIVQIVLAMFVATWSADRAICRLSDGNDAAGSTAPSSNTFAQSLPSLIAALLKSSSGFDEVNRVSDYLTALRNKLAALPDCCAAASADLFKELRSGLSEGGLTKETPIPSFIRLAGQSDAELWSRSRRVLKERYTDDYVESRFLDYVRGSLRAVPE